MDMVLLIICYDQIKRRQLHVLVTYHLKCTGTVAIIPYLYAVTI